MNDNLLVDKSIDFAARILKLCKYLEDKKEYIISKQIARSGTSVGANINEAQYGSSKADFVSKLQISLKEAAETEYWIRLLFKAGYIDDKMFNSLLGDCIEVKKLLVASINTAKKNS